MSKEMIPRSIEVPKNNVVLTRGVFKKAFENNRGYLKRLSQDSILYWFRTKAGLPAPGEPYRGHFEDNIKGQTAGLFLMGAGNSLRWTEDSELRTRLNEIVACIDKCKDPDGFIEPIPKSEFGTREYPNYVRAWLNYGLKAAGLVGSQKALELLRGMQDWFNQCDERVIARHLGLGFQGTIADVEVYFSEVGCPEDLDTTITYYQDNQWLGQLISRSQRAIYQYTHQPHGTELEAITAYLDLYVATGKPLYWHAVNSAYQLFKEAWQHVGGGIVMIESLPEIYPGCNFTDPMHMYNELCCSAHWTYLNQRMHRLYPDVESYTAEIEASLYNIVVANQVEDKFIRYHAFIDQRKSRDFKTPVSCCAGLGTRILGSLPEFIYSLADDGVYINIYSASEIVWAHNGTPVTLTTETTQPVGDAVRISIKALASVPFTLRLRIPRWAKTNVTVAINGSQAAVGKPGTYLPITRTWTNGDEITLSLPMGFTVTKYTGADQAPKNKGRYAYEYGSLLLGITGVPDYENKYFRVINEPMNPASWLLPIDGKPGHFIIADKPGYEVMPYHEIMDEEFTCYPVIG